MSLCIQIKCPSLQIVSAAFNTKLSTLATDLAFFPFITVNYYDHSQVDIVTLSVVTPAP